MTYYKRVHIGGSRFYRITGRTELFPSVTTILSVIGKKFISRWETGLALTKFRSRVEERVVDGSVAEITTQEMDGWFEVRGTQHFVLCSNLFYSSHPNRRRTRNQVCNSGQPATLGHGRTNILRTCS
jgi:hypothetical protein